MPITSITYSRNFCIGNFLYETIGGTVTLGENQDPKEAISAINKLACEWNMQNNPHLADQNTVTLSQPPEPKTLPVTEVQKPRSIVDDIMSCDEIKVLEAYKLMVRGKPELQAAYDFKMAELEVNEAMKTTSCEHDYSDGTGTGWHVCKKCGDQF